MARLLLSYVDYDSLCITLCNEHIMFFCHVLHRRKREEHLSDYEKRMVGICGDPSFKPFVEGARIASESVKRLHGDAATQATSDIVELYRHANAVKRRYQRFVEAVAENTEGTVVSEKDKATRGEFVLKNHERVIEKSGLRADRENVWKVEIVCDVVRAALT
jgi:hypothetical protein